MRQEAIHIKLMTLCGCEKTMCVSFPPPETIKAFLRTPIMPFEAENYSSQKLMIKTRTFRLHHYSDTDGRHIPIYMEEEKPI